MQIFKTKAFARFARKEGITDAVLMEVAMSADIRPDADLGGGVIKQRIARSGQGKSGGYRTIVLYRKGTLAFFVHGYSKSVQDNISVAEVSAFKELATLYLNLAPENIRALVEAGKIVKVVPNGKK